MSFRWQMHPESDKRCGIRKTDISMIHMCHHFFPLFYQYLHIVPSFTWHEMQLLHNRLTNGQSSPTQRVVCIKKKQKMLYLTLSNHYKLQNSYHAIKNRTHYHISFSCVHTPQLPHRSPKTPPSSSSNALASWRIQKQNNSQKYLNKMDRSLSSN